MKRIIVLLVAICAIFSACEKSKNSVSQGESEPLKIGDLVERDGVKGVVFYTDGSVTKIVSVEEGLAKWSTEFVATGATDMDSGANNMAIIKAIDGWEDKYPAFKWCADYGAGWYLPALNELVEIYNQRELIETALLANGYKSFEISDNPYYWSSTEFNHVSVNDFLFSKGEPYKHIRNSEHRVRCVLALTK